MDRWEIFLFQNLLLRCKSTQLLLSYQEKSQTIGKAEFAAQKAAVQLSEVSTSGTHRCLRLKFGNLSVLSDIKQLLIKVSNKIQGQQSCLTDNICYSFSKTLKSSLSPINAKNVGQQLLMMTGEIFFMNTLMVIP